MKLPPNQPQAHPFAVKWTSRIALFSASFLIVGLFAHRVLSMPTPITLNLIKLAMLGALVSLLLGLIATIQMWRKATPGVARIITGALVSAALLTWPLSQYTAYTTLPPINDITTDWQNPPPFQKVASMRPQGANPTTYPGVEFNHAQKKAYPDLVALDVNRSAVEAFEVVADALKRQGLTIVNEVVPDAKTNAPGLIEAYDRTLILGFYDDVAVRIAGGVISARIDVRSASRFGRHDFGQNAIRVRALLKEIVTRLEASVPSARKQPKPDQTAKPKKKRKKRRRKRRRRN